MSIEILVPDIGDFDAVDVVEVLVGPGDTVAKDDPIIMLESDKASMEVPSSTAGEVVKVTVEVGSQVSKGTVIAIVEAAAEEPVADKAAPAAEAKEEPAPAPKAVTPAPTPAPSPQPVKAVAAPKQEGGAEKTLPHASPSVRKFARELGVDLLKVPGTGRKGRIVKEDVQRFVKQALAEPQTTTTGGAGIPPMPKIDFAKFGEIEVEPLNKIRKLSAANLHRSWLHVPHVTQHDEADITDMEDFRKAHSEEAKKRGYKLTPLVFLMKAAVAALKEYPRFNSSLDPSGEQLIYKRYFHLGIAVDTPNGLVVPVVRDVDQKSLYQLAEELGTLSAKARDGKLGLSDIQGACFTISSLGGIGGTAFTPIVNSPEVAILGVSRSSMKPVWQGDAFEPRLMLPLSLSYDHRVIDGAAAARFTTYLSRVLGDIRRLLL